MCVRPYNIVIFIDENKNLIRVFKIFIKVFEKFPKMCYKIKKRVEISKERQRVYPD